VNLIQKFRIAFAAVILLAGCATTQRPELDTTAVDAEKAIQVELAFDNLLNYQRQLDPIARPILLSATTFCEDKLTNDVGAFVANKYSFAKEFREVATQRGIGLEPQVLWLIEGGPSQAAGLRVGDRIVAVGSGSIGAGRDSMDEYAKALRKQRNTAGPLALTAMRDGESITLSVAAQMACDYPVSAILDLTPNAYADGSRIAIHSGLMRFFDRPEDLQVIIGHELAHNVKGHISKGMVGWVLGTVLDIAIGIDEPIFGELGATAFSPELEAEADYVGLYMAANAGVEIHAAESIWRAFGAESAGDKDRNFLDTHPPSPDRFVAIRATVAEIDVKRARGEALQPN